MADTTRFGHDQVGHLLADHLLEVPPFQRRYSWDEGNVDEFLADLAAARGKGVDYFLGTVVFAKPPAEDGRLRIVDGQQRLTTTAVVLIAIRDLLRKYDDERRAEETEKRFLRGYVLKLGTEVERLILSPSDVDEYTLLLEGRADEVPPGHALAKSYAACRAYLEAIAPSSAEIQQLIDVTLQLENGVQVLVAEASDLPEAYVIFETLNDRGADLTTADLLKNFLFSASGQYFEYVSNNWTQLEANLERPNELVKFIRFHHASEYGPTTARKLYRAVQGEIGSQPKDIRQFTKQLLETQKVYVALNDPLSSFWGDVNVDVSDALLGFRRFGFEGSFPVILAAFREWDRDKAAKLLVKLAGWSIRAQYVGRLGGGVAEESFGDAARGISEGTIKNQSEVRSAISRIVPDDKEFAAAFQTNGGVPSARAKYLLAMLEKAADQKANRPTRALDWSSRRITIEHIMPASQAAKEPDLIVDAIGNLALLEDRLNRQCGSKPFKDRRKFYEQSDYALTVNLASHDKWTLKQVEDRVKALSELACVAWPDQ